MEAQTKSKVNSYLSFLIGEEEYAAHVDVVLNILEVQEITKVPNSPAYMKGVINLRGIALPVIDTRAKFGMTHTEFTDRTCIVVMDLHTENEIIHIGALVDSVEAVYDIESSAIAEPPSIGTTYKSEFITGITEIEGKYVMILDLVKLFTTTELKQIERI